MKQHFIHTAILFFIVGGVFMFGVMGLAGAYAWDQPHPPTMPTKSIYIHAPDNMELKWTDHKWACKQQWFQNLYIPADSSVGHL